MAFTLRATSHGVFTFVEFPKENRLSVLLCYLDETLVKHGTAFVRFDDRNYRQSSKNRPIDGSDKDGSRHHIVLRRERLSIKAKVAHSHRRLEINKKKDPISSTPTKLDNESIVWLPTLEGLEPTHGDLKPAYFNSPLTVSPALMARVDFAQRYLRTNGAERVQVPFKKEGARRGIRRPMARELVLELEVNDDHFVLQSDPLDGPIGHPAKHDMRFDANGDDTIDIFIGNESFSDVYRTTPPIVPIDVVDKEASKEYKFYYQLCADPPPDPKTLPHVAARPSGQPFCSGTGGGSGQGGNG
jgi:hypothetical protein